MADMPDDQIRGLDELCKEVRSILRNAYGACVFFEHGIRGEGSGGCGIDHAHMHTVPLMGKGVLNILAQKFECSDIDSLADIKRVAERNSSYLFFENSSAQRYVFPVNNLPSQYLRRLVAESVGRKDWNWRERGHEPELISTVERLSPLFSAFTTTHRG
jgi:hypothetical protein